MYIQVHTHAHRVCRGQRSISAGVSPGAIYLSPPYFHACVYMCGMHV